MVDKAGYPKELALFEHEMINICLNNLVWDIERGNLLKLVKG
jgi:hypothetical protein